MTHAPQDKHTPDSTDQALSGQPDHATPAADAAQARTWRMWAGDYGKSFRHFGTRTHVLNYGGTPVEVDVAECADGPYWGWLANGAASPDTIYDRENLFLVCFPYGPPVERGAVLRLSVQLVTE